MTGIAPKHAEPRKEAVKHISFKPSDIKENYERRHVQPAHPSLLGPTNDNLQIGLRPFDQANKTSSKEYNEEKVMGMKKRVTNIYDQRNGLPMASLGDKIYKSPDYTPGFFKEGGLVAGST